MFTFEELTEITQRPEFVEDIGDVRQTLVNHRMRQPAHLSAGSADRLAHFAEAVLTSAPAWQPEDRVELCRTAAEVSEVLSTNLRPANAKAFRLRAAVLYELADLPSIAASMLDDSDVSPRLISFFKRSEQFSKLNGSVPLPQLDVSQLSLGEKALLDDAAEYLEVAQNSNSTTLQDVGQRSSVSALAAQVGLGYELGLTATELLAFSTLLRSRMNRLAISRLPASLIPSLRRMSFPLEFLPSQNFALDQGLLDKNIPAWGFAAPTGTGKTYISRLLILDTLESYSDRKVLYIVPRACSH
ncbi:hypothetical protein BJI67_03140 [Acidihalobacter aeolianus]|uniref:Helicase/UvrB N-terminal domain-containing protein n=1 Tax=Acidihalobacter aeolianus TaxID=2792603 RepID=A0A1D8K5F8_9GAMM|nr:DEAD/DEAH box helicase family protein [Acidihalobacter aeolianus]AOV16196.1 hypothetical protein BJI67_03140 [Acidihalobacter aeolianus]